MLKAHRKDVTSLIKGKKGSLGLGCVCNLFCPSASGNLKDKEREIREKLVLKLKRKAESGVASQEGRVTKVGLAFGFSKNASAIFGFFRSKLKIWKQ